MNDDLTTRLARSLSDHADTMTGSSLGLGDVQGRARSIRRRRTATAVVGVAAAIGLLVPTVALASHTGGTPEPMPATRLTQTPTSAPTSAPTTAATDQGTQPPRGVLDVSDLPAGAPPALDYVQGRTLHTTDGSAVRLRTQGTPCGFVELDDGSRVWLTARDGDFQVEVQDADGTFHDPVPSGSDLRVNPEHTIAAWLTRDGQVTVWEGRAGEPTTLGDRVPGTEWRLGPVSGTKCALACTVVVNGSDTQGDRQPYEVTPDGTQPLTDGGYLVVKDTSTAGLSIGWNEITPDGDTCSVLLGGGEFQGFRTCRHTLESFSPSGDLVLGTPSHPDGAGPNQVAMYSLDAAKPLFARSATADAQAYYTAATWEDDQHVLIAAYQGGNWSVVRVASDGTMEYAVAPTPGDDVDSPFVLPTGSGL